MVALQRLLDVGTILLGATNVPLYLVDGQAFNEYLWPSSCGVWRGCAGFPGSQGSHRAGDIGLRKSRRENPGGVAGQRALCRDDRHIYVPLGGLRVQHDAA